MAQATLQAQFPLVPVWCQQRHLATKSPGLGNGEGSRGSHPAVTARRNTQSISYQAAAGGVLEHHRLVTFSWVPPASLRLRTGTANLSLSCSNTAPLGQNSLFCLQRMSTSAGMEYLQD